MSQDRIRSEFLDTVRKALGRDAPIDDVRVSESTALSDAPSEVERRIEHIIRMQEAAADQLTNELSASAQEAGWVVKRVVHGSAAQCVRGIADALDAVNVLRSGHSVLDAIGLDAAFEGSPIAVEKIAYEQSCTPPDAQRATFRQKMLDADVGVTGVAYAVAETGSVAITAGNGVSRLISLLPPVHVAVVLPSQILPSLDELFSILRGDFLERGSLDYTNIISGPSRSADIDQTLIRGMHGPREAYMVIAE